MREKPFLEFSVTVSFKLSTLLLTFQLIFYIKPLKTINLFIIFIIKKIKLNKLLI